MPYNGSGSFSPPGADFPAVANTLIESTKFNNIINDIATGLSTAITKDGQTTITASIPMSGNKFTGLGVGSSSQDSATFSQITSMGVISNLSLAASVGASALTISLKDRAGSDPSSGSPLRIPLRNSTIATGDYTDIPITGATSLVVSSGSTLGTSNNVAFRLWIVGFNDAGTFRLGVVNCLSGSSIMALRDDAVYSSTAEGGGGAADSAQVIYTGTAVTSKALRILGYMEWSSGLATAGTWSGAPTKIQIFEPGISKPGQIVQTARTDTATTATGTTQVTYDNNVPQNTAGDQYMSQAITPQSAANILNVKAVGFFSTTAGDKIAGLLFQDSTAGALASAPALVIAASNDSQVPVPIDYKMRAGTVSATTFKYRAGAASAGTTRFNGAAGTGAARFGATINSFIQVDEVMA